MGMHIKRLYTKKDIDPLKGVEFVEFKVTDFAKSGPEVIVMAPKVWSQTAVDILYNKYMRKAGVPLETERHGWLGLPKSLRPSRAKEGLVAFGGETDAKQVFHRIAGHWAWASIDHGLLDADNAIALYDEISYMLAMQIFAPNSPQWFNTGLWWAYGLEGDTANWVARPGEKAAKLHNRSAYRFPQASACFINSINDSLIGKGGILDLLKTEAQIFKYGSGSGANFSKIRGRGEPLSSGGKSSGLMSFLRVFDVNAGAIKSGGTTRRAAKMVVVDADHPEAIDFIRWKSREEMKVLAMSVGANTIRTWDADDFAHVDDTNLLTSLTIEWESEAYQTVGGQNSNNSLRVTDEFMQRVEQDLEPEAGLFAELCKATWQSGDPGLQFHDTCNRWHTAPAAGPQKATNPCSEFSFIDDSACNLASINLVKFVDDNGRFLCERFSRVVRLIIMVLDLTIDISSYPTAKIAENSVDYRPLGLGFTNLGGMLMTMGLPYASRKGRNVASAVASLMQASAWHASQELAQCKAPFRNYTENAAAVSTVLDMHKKAHKDRSPPGLMDHDLTAPIWNYANDMWKSCNSTGIRNAQLTLLAPTGTIGLVMDCATTGIEPEYSLVKHKKLAGGGSINLVNPLVSIALQRLGYNNAKIMNILAHIDRNGVVPEDLEHASVFECAGDMDWNDHLEMMAAVQPFLSGAISKTVNMPNEAVIEDIRQCYLVAWNLGLKAVAPYRDGSKLAQPLTKRTKSATDPRPTNPVETTTQRPTREKLPNMRRGIVHKVNIGGHSVYLHTGEYPDGRLGEIFLNIGGEGSTMALFMNALARSVSIGLQYGIPLSAFTEAFMHASGEPSGAVRGSNAVRFCSSIVDYIARELHAYYDDYDGSVQETTSDPRAQSEHVYRTTQTNIAPRLPKLASEACKNCGKYTLVRNGTCLVCTTCGETTGCS